MIAEWSRGRSGVDFVDSFDLFLDGGGLPRETLFIADRLHHTREAYRLRAERLLPVLRERIKAVSASGKT